MKQRLQKIISAAGVTSRRKAEGMLREGRVTVNGLMAQLGDSADPYTDDVRIDGELIARPARCTYIILNKPRGYVTTLSDEKNRHCVSELVRDAGVRLYPVGRLDMYSEGLLIMTDDGEFANRMMHPSSDTNKTYRAWISGDCTERALSVMQSRLSIDGYVIRPAQVSVIGRDGDCTVLEIVIHEGRNRQIRKMCDIAGLKLTRLKRVAEGKLLLGDLKSGHWRYLTPEELQDV